MSKQVAENEADARPMLGPFDVLYDPDAIRDLLAADSHPAHAMSRLPRKLEAEIAKGNAFFSTDVFVTPMPILIVSEEESGALAADGSVEQTGTLVVPSGQLRATQTDHPANPQASSPERCIASVPPGEYRVRVVRSPEKPSRTERASERLSGEDQRALTRLDRWYRWYLPTLLFLMTGALWVQPSDRQRFEDWFGIHLPPMPEWLEWVWRWSMVPGIPYLLWVWFLRLRPATRDAKKRLRREIVALRAEERELTKEKGNQNLTCVLSIVGPTQPQAS